MDTGKIKKFATEARNVFMQGVTQRLFSMGFNPDGTTTERPQLFDGGATFMGDIVSQDFYEKWMSLEHAVHSKSLTEVTEEAAYTWFNRLVAIRIMVKNKLITPVLSYESDDVRIPILVNEARQGRMPQMDDGTKEKLIELLNDDSKTSEQFRILIVAYCHSNPVINKCFGKISDYTELLLPSNILSEGGFVDMLNNTEFISNEDYRSPELIGWLYQFYISDRKDEAFAKKGKYNQDEIAAATQIFTPNWIVKYMTQSTLAKIYFDKCADETMQKKFPYGVGLDKVSPEEERFHFDELEQLNCADLACGSGHILNELFDILYWLYSQEGYSRRNSITNIFHKNLIGIDIDTRAKQLAMFALLMKATQKDQSFLDAKVLPRVYDMPRAFEGDLTNCLRNFLMSDDKVAIKELTDAINLMNDSQTLGSIIKFSISERTRNIITIRTEEYEEQTYINKNVQKLLPFIRIILALTDKYAVICMNPPYLGTKRMDKIMSDYVSFSYPKSKNDLFSIFMDVAFDRLQPNGKYGMINRQTWMYNTYFTEHRETLLIEQQIDSLLHLGSHTFDELNGEIVQNVAFVICKHLPIVGATFVKLIDGLNCSDKEKMFLEHSPSIIFSDVKQDRFSKIRLSPMGSYLASDTVLDLFKNNPIISDKTDVFQGLSTAANSLFLRLWHEVNINNFFNECTSREESRIITKKWYPCNKGGGQRKWYGNHYEVIDWKNDGYNIRQNSSSAIRADECHFKPTITWNKISGKFVTFRYYPLGFVLESASNAIPYEDVDGLLGFLNTKLTIKITQILNESTNLSNGVVARFPYLSINNHSLINLINECVNISRYDWDAHETSWDFRENELVTQTHNNHISVVWGNETPTEWTPFSLRMLYNAYRAEWEDRFKQLHSNEEELNRHFIEIYVLQDELTPDVPLDEITILQQGEISIENNEIVWHANIVMKQLICYAVGCIMGRYSIDKPGLILANQGDGLKEYKALVPDSRFEIDEDGIIPLMSSNTEFTDCATKRFKTWLSITFGEQNLVDNLNFIEASLGKNIDDYFVKDFWKDHKKMYQNRPIYWLFSSNKGAFQCITYMHRMNPYTTEAIRTKYLLPHIEWLVNKQKEMQSNMINLSTRERKELDSITAQIAECRDYHDRLHFIADQQIGFDLDDGVVVNYAKFGDVLAKIK